MIKQTARTKRLKDFSDRKKADPNSVIKVPDHGWEYIPVHPMSNETELLKKLGIKSIDCSQVDCYWKVNDDVVFLQVLSRQYLSNRAPGLYARWSNGTLAMLYLSAYVKHDSISQKTVEKVMLKFDSINLKGPLFTKTKLSEDKMIFISAL